MTDRPLKDAIAKIIRLEFGETPDRITRMSHGNCNEVYDVEMPGREVIVRLNTDPRYMLGARNHIPLFRSKGIKVPEILAEDYSKSTLPFAYQVQSRIDGRDIVDVIETLTDDELRAIAAEIANIFRQLSSVPNNGKFGVLWGDDKDLVDSWSAEVARVTKVVIEWGSRTGVLDAKLENILNWINDEYESYFDRVRPYTYFGDLSSKNVMIHEGRFAGLVDLDSLAQGDPLEAIGRIKASWYGTNYGQVYTEAILDSLRLSSEQRKLVTMYALLNRIFWTLENGIKFNQNSSATVDRDKETHDKRIVAELLAELKGMRPTAAAIAESSSETASPAEPSEPTVAPVKRTRKSRSTVADTYSPLAPAGESEIDVLELKLANNFIEFPAESRPNDIQAQPVKPLSSQKIMLEASGLSKTYVSDGVGFDALKDVDLRINAGDCVAIVGKSGSGKSTLMHMLACLDLPTDGYVYIDGDETSTMSESEKNRLRNEKFGFVFQQFFLNGRDTVFENVVLPMRIRGVSYFDMITDADEALASVGLTDKSDKKAKDLSGGEKQRVCIAPCACWEATGHFRR